MEINEQVEKILAYGDCCDHCLGRFFAKRSHGLSNDERGKGLRVARALTSNQPYEWHKGTCWICGDFFENVPEWAKKVAEALTGYEYQTFLIGCRVPPLIAENEEMVWSDLTLGEPEPFKSEVNREVGKAVSAITGKVVDFKRPDVVALIDPATMSVEIQIHPLFFYGRYQKFERGIPQTHWNCRACKGAGCEKCNYTGKQYQDSVEELIGKPVIETFDAENAILHGAGREDIDARMIGTGRPFIMEIVTPRKRSIGLTEIEERINRESEGRVAVSELHWSERSDVETLKSSKAHKKYRILVEVEGQLPAETLVKALNTLKGVTIQQRTPERVAHRRADKVRERKVLDIEFVEEQDGKFVLEVLGEAGLYIKELISGDQGRTTPSLAEILNLSAHVVSLDVVQVEGPQEGD